VTRLAARILICLIAVFLMHPAVAEPRLLPDPEPAPGISRELAAWRSSRYADLRYALRFELSPSLDRVQGSLRIQWRFTAPPVDLVLDWRPASVVGSVPGRVTAASANGQRLAPATLVDHLVIPAGSLHPGENVVELAFESPVATAGTALTRYRDREDGSNYVYTLLVPADASSLFPCIDQPDLKARFRLELSVPGGWTAVANAVLTETRSMGETVSFAFAETEPISTYLFAFAAGPFVEFRDEASGVRLLARRAREQRARAEAGEVLRLNREALRYFEEYFAQGFPFAKYDLVLLPEFAYAGMEHAGATFLREDAILFPFEPATSDRLRRAQLIFHETAHQWFGDLVTMRWFDDLWLKEGFANLMASKAAQALVPEVDARNALRALKLSAYRTDVTRGTTPIWQALPNLSAAKSAYGSIVYSKAPAVLYQAEFFLGEMVFREAVRAFIARHRYGAASWQDLVMAFERASGRDMDGWSQAWVNRAGVPEIAASVDVDGEGRLASIRLHQRDALQAGGSWPQRVKLALVHAGRGSEVLEVMLEGAESVVPGGGRPLPDIVFANYDDHGYGIFLLDERSRAALQSGLERIEDDFLRALLWDALWEAVRRGDLPPAQWVELALRDLDIERDEITVSGVLGNLQTALRWYMCEDEREALQQRVEEMLAEQMLEAPTLSLRIAYFRAYAAMARTPQAGTELKRLLAREREVPGLALRTAERYRILQSLLAAGDPGTDALLAEQATADTTDDSRRFAYATGAARPEAVVKQRYFDAFLQDAQLPERWIEESLPAFNVVEQDALTLPYLEPALRALPRLKRERRIFFVNNWLAAFIGGQRSQHALEVVERFLREEPLDDDLRRKLLEAVDGLQRTVQIRSKGTR
jgi:aminopeptidase N